MKKNVSSQVIGTQMLALDGSAFTGSVTIYVTGDNGTQTIGSVGSGVCTHKGNGYHSYTPSQAETNFNHIAWSFIGTGAVPVTLQDYTSFPQSGDSFTTTQFLPSVAPGTAGGLLFAGANLATSYTEGITISAGSGTPGLNIFGGFNAPAVALSGGGSGEGLLATGGSSNGAGIKIDGGGSSGYGFRVTAGSSGIGASFSGGIYGIRAIGSANGTAISVLGSGTGTGLEIAGGATSGDAMKLTTTSGVPLAFQITAGYSFQAVMRLLASAGMGKVSGAGTTTEVFRDIDDTKNAITATVDASGNRTALTLDAT